MSFVNAQPFNFSALRHVPFFTILTGVAVGVLAGYPVGGYAVTVSGSLGLAAMMRFEKNRCFAAGHLACVLTPIVGATAFGAVKHIDKADYRIEQRYEAAETDGTLRNGRVVKQAGYIDYITGKGNGEIKRVCLAQNGAVLSRDKRLSGPPAGIFLPTVRYMVSGVSKFVR